MVAFSGATDESKCGGTDDSQKLSDFSLQQSNECGIPLVDVREEENLNQLA